MNHEAASGHREKPKETIIVVLLLTQRCAQMHQKEFPQIIPKKQTRKTTIQTYTKHNKQQETQSYTKLHTT